MVKRKYRFAEDYLDSYGKKIFTIRRYRNKPTTMRINARKHRDAQQWAYRDGAK